MFWLGRPPYLRWAAAALIVAAAAAFELNKRVTVPYPFAAAGIPRGDVISSDAVEWRDIPSGLLDPPDLSRPIAARDLVSGEPITPTAVTADLVVPDGWWAVPVGVPAVATRGTAVRLVLTETQALVDGVVVVPSSREVLSISDAGLVAVPSEHATAVAVAAIDGTLVVLVAP